MWRALLYAYVLGGLTFIPLLVAGVIFIGIYTSVPVGDPDVTKKARGALEANSHSQDSEKEKSLEEDGQPLETNDLPRTRKGWLTMRRTFEEPTGDGSYVTLVRSFLDSRSKDPKRSRPKDMWYVALKGKVLYLYEDEDMKDCEAAIELSGHQVVIYPEGLPDAELFAKRNAIALKPRPLNANGLQSVTKEMRLKEEVKVDTPASRRKSDSHREALQEAEKKADTARQEAFDPSTPWFIFVRSNVEMEDWYFALIHASEQPTQTPTLSPLHAVFDPADMNYLVSTLDEQPDVIPMRWLNALLGRIFFSQYRTQHLESYIIGRFMKKLAKVKRPGFLTEIAVTEVSVGNRAPMLSKPMLKELTKEGDASLEVHLQYKGEVRITVEATAVINLAARFKPYTVKLVLAAVLKELEGNLLIKVKRPPSNRIWYAFTQTPRIVMDVEPIVSDRQLTWGMILSTIESQFKAIIQESVVMPNMDDIAFFDTETYEHRGGIWSDACRKPLPAPVPPPPTPFSPPPPPPPPETTTADVPLPPVSKSATDITAAASIDAPSVDATKDDSGSDTSSSSAKRRTWFGSSQGDADTPTVLTSDDVRTPTADDRGRPLQAHVRSPSAGSNLTPRLNDRSASRDSRSEASQDAEPFAIKSRRLSHHSAKSADARSEDEEGSVVSSSRSRPVTPRKKSDASETTRPVSPQSFFSTLKSKAADKQGLTTKEALSNTAKEAMRKWGVNWGGFKKDGNGDDQTPIATSPPRTSAFSETLQKAKASYAEVKAAVDERFGSQSQPDTTTTSAPASSSATVAEKLARLRSPFPANNSIYAETPSNPSIVSSSTRPTSPHLVSKKSIPSISIAGQDVELPPAEVQKPIFVQPQAKTMSIPGIHVSHRGEVQSLGYVAPPPPPAPTPAEGVAKNLQNVYRLWKTPSASSANEGTSPAPAAVANSISSSSTASDSRSSSEGKEAARRKSTSYGPTDPGAPPMSGSSSNSTSAPVSLKATPPPLPPRSTPVTTTATKRGNQQYPTPEMHSVPSASDSLKAIVQKDDTQHHAFVDNVEDSNVGVLGPDSSEPGREPMPSTDSVDSVTTMRKSSLDSGPTDTTRTIVDGTPTVDLLNEVAESSSSTVTTPPTTPRRIQTLA